MTRIDLNKDILFAAGLTLLQVQKAYHAAKESPAARLIEFKMKGDPFGSGKWALTGEVKGLTKYQEKVPGCLTIYI